VAICPNCGQDNPERAMSCVECAALLKTRPVLPQEACKPVAVLFCDLVGSAALGDRLTPSLLKRSWIATSPV
jgi:hypothetical protein